MSKDTVAAISTPLGEGGIGIVRISGESAFSVADRIFTSVSGKKVSEIKGYTALFGFVHENGEKLDEAVALKFVSPKSYTGENVVEISVHSGLFVLKQVLRLAVLNGARTANPGEFTERAYLNGKLDLTEAESVMGIISSANAQQLKIAAAAKSGRIGKATEEITDILLKIASGIAVYSDYPDEEFEGANVNDFEKMLGEAEEKLQSLVSSFDVGRMITGGIETAIVGRPNVGKSTLMNMLSGTERSIVTSVAGTTRDVVEDTVMLGDTLLKLYDTAGIRETEDIVEKVGVERAKEKLKNAQLVLAVFDVSEPLTDEDLKLIDSIKETPAIAVLNKTDKGINTDEEAFGDLIKVYISAETGEGKKELEAAVTKKAGLDRLDTCSAVLLTERQKERALNALTAVGKAKDALLSGMTVDAVGVLTDDAVNELFSLTGKRITEEVANEVFRRFCVGK